MKKAIENDINNNISRRLKRLLMIEDIKEYEENEMLMDEIKMLLTSPKQIVITLFIIEVKKIDLQKLASLVDLLECIDNYIEDQKLFLQKMNDG